MSDPVPDTKRISEADKDLSSEAPASNDSDPSPPAPSLHDSAHLDSAADEPAPQDEPPSPDKGVLPDEPAPPKAADSYSPPDLPWEDGPHDFPEGDDGSMTLVAHLEELRTRILICLGTMFFTALGAYSQSEAILSGLTAAAPDHTFVFLSPTEAFFTHLTLAFYTGLLVAAPVTLFQLWQFLRPGLTAKERALTRGLFPIVVLFFFGGAAFAFLVIRPAGLKFLLGFASSNLQAMLSIQEYTSFVLTFLLVFGLAFQLPVLMFAAAKMGLVHRDELSEGRPYFLVGLVTLSALLTPPDVATQLLLAFPVWLLFEATLLLLPR